MKSLAPNPDRWIPQWKNGASYYGDLLQYAEDAASYVDAGGSLQEIRDDKPHNIFSELGQDTALHNAAQGIVPLPSRLQVELGLNVLRPLDWTANSYNDFAMTLQSAREGGSATDTDAETKFGVFTTNLGKLMDSLNGLKTFAQGLQDTLTTNHQVYVAISASLTADWIADAAKRANISTDAARESLKLDVLSRLVGLDPMAASNIAGELQDIVAILKTLMPKTSADLASQISGAESPFDAVTVQSDSDAWQKISSQCTPF